MIVQVYGSICWALLKPPIINKRKQPYTGV